MYALVSVLFSDAGNSIFSAGQAHPIHGAAAAAQEAAKANRLRDTRFVRYWLDDARPSGAPQGYAGMVG
jgi:hypothetical protein